MQDNQTAPSPDWTDQLQAQTFTFAAFQFTMRALEHAFLPEYKGSTLRGGFGHSFRRVCCTMNHQDCNTCLLNQSCAYAYIFETPKVSSMAVQHQTENLPHPFVIEPPAAQQTEFNAGDEFDIGLVLVGKSIAFLPYFVYTFDQMGKLGLGKGRGRFGLTTVFARTDLVSAAREQIYDAGSQMLSGNFKTWCLADLWALDTSPFSEQITLQLLTPTRILHQNNLVHAIPYDLLVRNLLRRVSLLAQVHCDSTWDLPYHDIISHAEQEVKLVKSQTHWHDWERYSNRQQTRMKMGGVIGTLVYAGNLAPLLPLIWLGQFTHIGKNTSFGLGKFVVERCG